MTNEAITYPEFARRLRALRPHTRGRIIKLAWEECAWISTLTDERILRALNDARQLHKKRKAA